MASVRFADFWSFTTRIKEQNSGKITTSHGRFRNKDNIAQLSGIANRYSISQAEKSGFGPYHQLKKNTKQVSWFTSVWHNDG